ncbi:lysylphosphatidylglycerol synthase domain-containing protein [Ekhidna sp. MALMAid0563]|uniref:lysylphosphatidylglycerol synthase domain-containing protein n=1 Tax=Ekhidna sp. MALMAid0563 TaxID=3143937 RepID=UPI0032DF1536
MQIKNNHSNYLQNTWIIGLIKLVLFGGCLYFIITKFQDQLFRFRETVWPDSFGMVLGLVGILMIINWYLEALRWKVSLQSFEPITIKKAWQIILSGLALNWVLPLTTGDLLARISQQQDKYQTTSAAMLNRGIMLCFTLILGIYGMSKVAMVYEVNGWFTLLLIFSYPIIRWLFKKSLDRFFTYFRNIDRTTLIRIIGLSLARYLVFVFQFYLLLFAFLPDLPSDLLLAGIGWVFLIRSALPLFFGGVGVREASGIVFFEPYVSDLQLIIIPIFLIWMINTVLPSLVGLVFVFQFRVNIAR